MIVLLQCVTGDCLHPGSTGAPWELSLIASRKACSNTGTSDCGIRTDSVDRGVVDASESFTVLAWIHKSRDISRGEWWHIFTDGESGDILTIYGNSGSGRHGGRFRTSMNNPSKGGVFTSVNVCFHDTG